jgi:hypothetical protein
MKRTLMAVAVLCVVAVMFGCKKKNEETAPGLTPLTVTISIDPATQKPKADPDPVYVKPNDEVVWVTSPADQDFDVSFKTDTPFQDGKFNKGRNKSGKSKITVPPGQEKKFAYSITFQGKTTDPDVIIKPGGGANDR